MSSAFRSRLGATGQKGRGYVAHGRLQSSLSGGLGRSWRSFCLIFSPSFFTSICYRFFIDVGGVWGGFSLLSLLACSAFVGCLACLAYLATKYGTYFELKLWLALLLAFAFFCLLWLALACFGLLWLLCLLALSVPLLLRFCLYVGSFFAFFCSCGSFSRFFGVS